ncbi:hypothetical protein ACQPYK_48510 (plasmid) [Streptosporangium sp. CA-135522]|uniref:hypothetical protein n=1 Tax=Streptosporangium sp. CA-135522 TaxID=3240072 RepID=UPI003D8BCBD8
MSTEPSVSPPPASSAEPAEEPSASARLTISAVPFKGELQAQVPAHEANSMINMVGCVIIVVTLTIGVPMVVLYLGPTAGLNPTAIAVLIAADLLIAAVWLLRCHTIRRTSARRPSGRSRKHGAA